MLSHNLYRRGDKSSSAAEEHHWRWQLRAQTSEVGMEIKIPSLLSFIFYWEVWETEKHPLESESHFTISTQNSLPLVLGCTVHSIHLQVAWPWWFVVESYFRIENCWFHQLQKSLDLMTDQEIRHISLEFEDMIAPCESRTLPTVVASTVFKLHSLWCAGKPSCWSMLPAMYFL